MLQSHPNHIPTSDLSSNMLSFPIVGLATAVAPSPGPGLPGDKAEESQPVSVTTRTFWQTKSTTHLLHLGHHNINICRMLWEKNKVQVHLKPSPNVHLISLGIFSQCKIKETCHHMSEGFCGYKEVLMREVVEKRCSTHSL